MIVADTGAIVSLVDRSDQHHETLKSVFLQDPGAWVLPWAILPEVDYLVRKYLGRGPADDFLGDLAGLIWSVEWGKRSDLERARDLVAQYGSLDLGIVDAVVIAVAERLEADTIATLDLRDFGAVEIAGSPRLIPRDL